MEILIFLLFNEWSVALSFNSLVGNNAYSWEKEQGPSLVGELKEDSISHYKEGEYFEGDLAISQELIDAHYGPQNANSQTATRNSTQGRWPNSTQGRWPNNTVPFLFEKPFRAYLKSYFLYALHLWKSAVPCINFREGTDQLGYVKISTQDKGCYSTSIGYNGPKIHRINLGTGCMNMRTILHELGHILGTWHEQVRMDREDYVDIETQNIKKGYIRQFQKQFLSSTQGLEYDYSSVMHYPTNAFSNNGQPTIVVNNLVSYIRQGRPRLGHQYRLSSSDKLGMRRFYGC